MELPLGYERRSRKLLLRRYAFGLLLLILVCALFYNGTTVMRAFRVEYLIHECESIAPSSTVIGLEICSVEFAKQHPPQKNLSEKVDGSGIVRRPMAPGCLLDLAAWLGFRYNPQHNAVLFIGERLTPSGSQRLVVILRPYIDRGDDAFSGNFRAIVVNDEHVLKIQSAEMPCWTPENVTLERFDDFGRVTFFGGTSDPKERNHFAIPYEADGKRGWIDGWLEDDQSVTFKFRDGPGYSKDGGPKT